MSRLQTKSEQRNAQARAKLQPLAANERPAPLLAGAVLAVVFAVANLLVVLLGHKLPLAENRTNALITTYVMSGLLLIIGIGMFARKYWATLSFEAVLGIQLLTLSLALLQAKNALMALVICLLICILGWLFWKLIRVMGRMQITAKQAKQQDLPPVEVKDPLGS